MVILNLKIEKASKVKADFNQSLSIFLFCCLMACNADVNVSEMRSGDIDNDYVEDPLLKAAKKYETALETSNQGLEYIIKGDLDFMYDEIFSETAKRNVSAEQFKVYLEENRIKFGEISEYKKMQWKFLPSYKEGVGDVLYSVKIVKQGNTFVNYVFSFIDNGEYKKISGLHISKKNGVPRPGKI